ncbi:MAG: hypothetical protein J6A87_02160 [Clostridia bacterium]|nr:hypothetical protein [Clostridia bacterium]
MKTEEFIKRIKGENRIDPKRTNELRSQLPLGEYANGEYVLSHQINDPERYHHTCVSGSMRAEFIARLVLTLSGLYSRSEAVFLIVSPNLYYGQLMSLKSADVTVPFVLSERDIPPVLETVKKLAAMRQGKKTEAKTFLVLDGLELLEPENKRSTLDCYRPFFEAVGTSGIEMITGVDLANTIYAGYPSTFIGIGNCLVTPALDGEMDVTYVGIDGSMSSPQRAKYPSLPSLKECIEERNAQC